MHECESIRRKESWLMNVGLVFALHSVFPCTLARLNKLLLLVPIFQATYKEIMFAQYCITGKRHHHCQWTWINVLVCSTATADTRCRESKRLGLSQTSADWTCWQNMKPATSGVSKLPETPHMFFHPLPKNSFYMRLWIHRATVDWWCIEGTKRG